MIVKKKKITDIVGENYVYASVLHYFGIEFYNYSESTLEQVCKDKGLSVETVVEELELVGNEKGNGNDSLKLTTCPIELIIEYLKHAHYLFIKRRLPYIAQLIKDFHAQVPSLTRIDEDLKFVFPLFVEDFIHHIYDEEDTLFSYIMTLDKALKKSYNPSCLYYMMESHSIQQFAMEHDAHDDEMKGIRKITNNYQLEQGAPLHVRVIFSELQALESSLITHANVENQILFPRALALEKEVKAMLKKKVSFN